MNLRAMLGILFCVFISGASFAVKFTSVESYIQAQSLIRVAMDDAQGFGDIVASVNMMDDLRKYGFQGTFEVIYPDASANKLAMLFGLPDTLPAVYEDTRDKIRFMKFSEFKHRANNHLLDKAGLGITGALFESSGTWQPLLADKNNLATALNVEKFIWLNPWLEKMYGNQVYSIDQASPQVIDNADTFITMPVATLQQTKDYLLHDPNGQALLAKNPGMQTLMGAIETQHINFFAVYGWTITKRFNQEYEHDSSPGNILQVILGARYAELNGPAAYRNKPLVIAVFYDYHEEMAQLQKDIYSANWGSDEISGASQARDAIKKLGLAAPGVFIMASLSDPNTASIISQLKAGQILLLSMGALPKIVFDGLYTQTGPNIWPPLREGPNSFDSLILSGKPHFRCGNTASGPLRWERGYDEIPDTAFRQRLKDFYDPEGTSPDNNQKHFCHGIHTWEQRGDIAEIYGQFIIDADDPGSGISRYFQALKRSAEDKENDRLYRVLETALP